MQVSIRKTSDIYCVELVGKISYDSMENLRRVCQKQLLGKSLVINCEKLSFVGSVGITDFINLLSSLYKLKTQMKFVGIAKEFVRLAQSFAETKALRFEQYPTNYEAVKAYQNPVHRDASEGPSLQVVTDRELTD